MARKFLYGVAALVVLILAGAIALSLWFRQASEAAFVPRGAFVEQAPLAPNAYADGEMWYARPGQDSARLWQYRPGGAAEGAKEAVPPHVVFFVHPTSYVPLALTERADWNAALGEESAESRARLFLRGMASPFHGASALWAPKYRQAVAGAFLTDKPEAQQAIDAAYRDVREAFRQFLAEAPSDVPIVLAGHSQGALHLLRLLREEVAGKPVARRIAAAYAIGWPVSVEHDLPALPLSACGAAAEPGCLVAYSSFAEPADPAMLLTRYAATPGFDGEPRGDGPIVCVNPLTGTSGGSAPASANRGTLVPRADLSGGDLIPAAVPARCDRRGLLLIGDPPRMGEAVLPGNNFHVYDMLLFWKNIEADVATRVKAWRSRAAA